MTWMQRAAKRLVILHTGISRIDNLYKQERERERIDGRPSLQVHLSVSQCAVRGHVLGDSTYPAGSSGDDLVILVPFSVS